MISIYSVKIEMPAQSSLILVLKYFEKINKLTFPNQSCTTLIGCAESVPARKYTISRNPLKGALHITEVVRPIPELCLQTYNKLIVSNTLIVLNLITWNKIRVTKIVYFVYFTTTRSGLSTAFPWIVNIFCIFVYLLAKQSCTILYLSFKLELK
jgi:hypothetical protein